ncbi:adenylosuccinate lyase [Candidatus Margulisiibacteriota bacterium]
MKKIWENENKFNIWLKIEIAACEMNAKLGVIPKSAIPAIKKKAKFNIKRIDQIEKQVNHDVIAFLTSVAEKVGKDSRFIHRGLTSSDVVDTAFAVQIKESLALLIKDIDELLIILKRQAKRYKNTIMMGRTHGVHAEPMTFGMKMALWYLEMLRNKVRLEKAKDIISIGKLSGAVGTYSELNPKVEKYVCEKLGLKPAKLSTQIIQRDRHAEVMTTIAITAASLEKWATEIRNLQRSEIDEVEEPFTKKQKGSSAMPHKKNPIMCERVSGCARVIRGYALTSLENITLWHERDISHSSTERIIFPDATILLDYMFKIFTNIVAGIVVKKDNMKKNIANCGYVAFSQQYLLALINKGITREKAYRMIQINALKAKSEHSSFIENLKKDKEVIN